jgi:starch phosphorylase
MDEPAVAELGAKGYNPGSYYENNPQLKAALDLILSGHFSGGDQHLFDSVVYNLLHSDRFMALADFQSYVDAQARVEEKYADRDAWTRSAILNVARTGFFSSDRSMRDYIQRIWHTRPML